MLLHVFLAVLVLTVACGSFLIRDAEDDLTSERLKA